ncbi:MAG TPA: P-loop NTPase [Alphaproteobacteria bacterium]|nr:P-loop NTPase [Alphaproteobacteria bacterium]
MTATRPMLMPSRDADSGDHLAMASALLAERGADYAALVGDRAHILDRLSGGAKPRILLLDICTAIEPAADVAAIRAAVGTVPQLLVFGRVNDVHVFRALLDAGAADYVPVPVARETLAAAIDKLLASAQPAASTPGIGQAVAVIGTRGGVGASTVAVTLGWILAEEGRKRTALLDLDLQFGTLALSLDVDPGRGLRDALEQPERVDGLYIDRAAVKVGTNLYAFSAEEPVDDTLAFEPSAAGTLIGELKRKFDWTVVDVPRGMPDLAREVLAQSSYAIIVADCTLAGLRDTIRLNALATASNPEQRLIVLKGGALGGRGGVARGEFEKELGRPLDAAIPSDPKAAMESANAGQALPQAAPSSPVALAIRQIATKLDGTAPRRRKFRLALPFFKS